jgi:hypothetical protein
MANVAANICVPWPSTVASIPAGWSRETSLDSKFVRGAAAGADSDLVSSFGQATHTHTESGHTPVQNSHVHSVSSNANTGSTTYNTGGSNALAGSHSHAAADSDATTATNNSATITVNTASNDPPYRKVIWIKSDGTPTGFPNGCYAFFDSDTLPTSWTRSEGNKFLLGAAAGADGTGTGGSSDAHSHTESGTHTHTQNAHTHTGTSSASAATLIGGSSSTAAADGHHHAITLASATGTNNASSISVNNGDAQPPFYKLNIISNGTGGTDWPNSLIALYLGTNASIPANWARYTAMDGNFLKGCNANGEVAATGGGSQHSHTGTCTTTSPTHNHTASAAGADLAVGRGTGTAGVATVGHTHTWTSLTSTITHQGAAFTLNNNTSETNFPVYQKVIFVKWTAPAAGGARQYLPMLGVGS